MKKTLGNGPRNWIDEIIIRKRGMSFLSSIFSSDKSGAIVSLDIGTEFVKALVFYVDSSENKGIIIGASKVRQGKGNMQSGAVSDIAGVIETCRQAVDEACAKAGIKKVKKAIIGIAGELVKGTTTTVHYERAKPDSKIDFPELKTIIKQVQLKAYERIKKQLSWETGQDDLDIKLVNAAIVDVRIDGYQVSNPSGFQGKDVSISIFNAYAPMIHFGAVYSIAEELGVEPISISAEPYAVARSVDYEDVMDFSAIFIDIGGGTTDIAVVRNGGLEGTKMFAFGGRAFTKKVSQELKISFEEAENLKINYAEGKLGSDVAQKIEKILESDCNVWLGGVEISLSEFAETDILPSKVFLCGGGSALPGINKALKSQAWLKNLPFAKVPSVNYLQPKDVARMEDRTGQLRDPQDVTPMGLANLALDLANEEKFLAGILRRVVQSIEK